MTSRVDPALRLIAAFKLAKAALFLLLGAALIGLFGDEARTGRIVAWVGQARPGVLTHLAAGLLRRALALPAGERLVLEAGAFVYAGLFATEGVGLLRGRRWAEWLTIASTALLIPFEAYEAARHLTIVRSLALALNAAAVAYLVWRLRRDRVPA